MITYLIQTVTIILLAITNIDLVLRIFLIIGYIMLFRQERWHKHLSIMLLMVLILFVASGGFTLILGILKI